MCSQIHSGVWWGILSARGDKSTFVGGEVPVKKHTFVRLISTHLARKYRNNLIRSTKQMCPIHIFKIKGEMWRQPHTFVSTVYKYGALLEKNFVFISR